MSGLSQRTHGELNNIAANIVLSEKLGGRIKSYVSGTLSPIIKKNLNLLSPREEKVIRLRFGIEESIFDNENFPGV